MSQAYKEHDKLAEKIDLDLKAAMADDEELLMKQIDELIKAANTSLGDSVKVHEELNSAIDELLVRHSELTREKAGIICRNRAAELCKSQRLDEAFMVPADDKTIRKMVSRRALNQRIKIGLNLVAFCLLLFMLREFMPQKNAALIALSAMILWMFVGFESLEVFKGDKKLNWLTLALGLLISIAMIILCLHLYTGVG